jgi:hypothetical protein
MKKLYSTIIDVASAPGLLSTARSDLPNSNAANDTAFTPVPTAGTTPMGAFTNLTTQPNYVYLVSEQ